ncbi:MAG: glycerol-3-phosphate 1-O-acyltransferase PlsY [Actinomycetota bacterium]
MSSPADWGSTLIDLAAFGFGYLLGSIPFGLILMQLAGLGDVRKIGSGNIGATNVLRAGSKKLAAATLVLDAAKGTAAVLIAAKWGEMPAILAALGAFLGHLFPIWLGFRGGKGVATYIGVLLGLYWPAGIAFCVVWLLVAFLTRYSSLSALVASAASLALLAFMNEWRLVVLFLLLTMLLYIRHAANIARLARGEEARIGKSRP